MKLHQSLVQATICLLICCEAFEVDSHQRGVFIKSILEESGFHENNVKNRRELFQRRRFGFIGHGTLRRNEEDDQQIACDHAFLKCLPNDKCSNCFEDLYAKKIDWASVTPDTPCEDVLEVLAKGGHCEYLQGDDESTKDFCNTFNACALWTDEDDDEDDDLDDDDAFIPAGAGGNSSVIDCYNLTSCDWPGFHKSFIGDGICHEELPGCYNTEICGYDGGDCCEDTCKDSNYVKCGHDGYACKDPKSANCDAMMYACDNDDGGKKETKKLPKCEDGESIYRIIMYDSFGDGWDDTKLTVYPSANSNNIRFNGGLEDGSQGQDYMCLNKSPTCYHVGVSGGTWGNEVSWEIKPFSDGAPAVAGGGAPMSCDFGVAGDTCEKTCTGRPDISPNGDDPEYKDFKEMYECINSKCIIQVGACEKDPACNSCLDDDVSEYCYGVETFIAVVDCTLCSCTDREGSDFCSQKTTPGIVLPTEQKESAGPRPCSASDTIEGSNAVKKFHECTDFDEVAMMVTNFHEDHFGALDSFEACSHSYANKPNHGGHTALGCMQILVNSMNSAGNMDEDDDDADVPNEAISALAFNLYHDAENFCDCSKESSSLCPLCRSFVNFKTLLFESLDACQSLDEIDCDAWLEFSTPCKNNLIHNYGAVDFSNEEQCQYVHDTCGGAGPFPAFRKLDCDGEISSTAWDFYKLFSSSCLGGDNDEPVVPKPKPIKPATPETPSSYKKPTMAPVKPETPKPYRPYVPPKEYEPKESQEAKPYVPPEEQGKKKYVSSEEKQKSHWFRNLFLLCLLVGAGYYYYKRRSDSFSFIRYRRARPYNAGESEMYSSLAMDSGSSSFEPPTLPPTPAAMGGMS